MPADVEPNIRLLPEKQRDAIVDSQSFSLFLIGAPQFPFSNWQFAPSLDLQQYTPFIQELTQNDDSLISPKTQSNTDSSSLINQKKAEKGVTMYYDPADKMVHGSDISVGTEFEVKFPTAELISEGKVPMLEIHTHPSDQMFSPHDLIRMLSNVFVSGRSAVRGALVINPNLQILALPSAQTPSLLPEDANKLVEDISNEVDDKSTHLAKKGARYEDMLEAVANNMFIESFKSAADELNAKTASVQDVEQSLFLKMESLERKRDQAIAGVQNKFVSPAMNTGNQILIEMARSLQLKLYSSSDMRHFKEFTA
jgi:hypothetical protein